MRNLLLLTALFIFPLTSCENLHVDLLQTQVQKYVTPENVALAVTSSFLYDHPEADITMLQVADELRTLANGDGMLNLEDAYAKIEASLGKHNFEYKKEVLFILNGLLDQYAYVFDSNQVDIVSYRDTLFQFANGIEEAIAVQNARETLNKKD